MTDLARQLAFVAGDLDRRGYVWAAVVRRAARALLDGDHDELDRGGCRCCGAGLEQPARGRRRQWCPTCADRCRRAGTRKCAETPLSAA